MNCNKIQYKLQGPAKRPKIRFVYLYLSILIQIDISAYCNILNFTIEFDHETINFYIQLR